MMKTLLFLVGFAAISSLGAQGIERPRLTSDHILPVGSYVPRLLTRGQFVSIYGWNLLPKKWCEAPHEQREPYPKELCGVQVWIGDRRAGLLYAGSMGNPNMRADQINLQVPLDGPQSGSVPVRVCIEQICGDPVLVEFTAQDIILHVHEAFVHMPLWVDVEIPMNIGFGYPFSVCPWDFDGYTFEIRQSGRLLPLAQKPQCAPSRGPLYVSHSSKLPLHLVYHFDVPGTYEIRLSGPILSPDQTSVARIGISEWVPINVEPYPEARRIAWLNSMKEKADVSSEWRGSGEVIPSLLAWPDEQALAALLRFLPQPAPKKALTTHIDASNFNEVKNCIAPAALEIFSDALLSKYISPKRLEEIRSRCLLLSNR